MTRLTLKMAAWIATGLVAVFLIIDAATGREVKPVSVIGGFISLTAIVLWVVIAVRWRRKRTSERPPKPPRVREQTSAPREWDMPAPRQPKVNPARATTPKGKHPKVNRAEPGQLAVPVPRSSTSRSRTRSSVVRVAYRDLDSPAPDWDPSDIDRGYAFRWALGAPPTVGTRVYVKNADGDESPAVVVGIGSDHVGKLERVTRVATASEIDTANELRSGREHQWLDLARSAVDLSDTAASATPEGFPDIPPARGDASPEEAGEYGRTWWRAFKLAEELDREEDAKAFRSVAHRWYAIRDRG